MSSNYMFSLIWLCGLASTVICVDPKVSIAESDPSVAPNTNIMYAKRDQDVTMSCYVENLPLNTQVHWQRQYLDENNKNQTEPISNDQGVVDNTRYGIEKPTMFTWRLRIRNIPIAYEGTYMCYVYVVLQIKTFVERFVKVFVPPTLIPAQTSSDMTVKEGDTVDLLCNATGLPNPMIEWSRQGKALLPLGKEKHLGAKMEVVNIQAHHRGKYRCIAFNRIGSVVRNIEVKVKFKPIVTVVTRTVRQAPGYRTELQCIVESNPDPNEEQLAWYKGAVSISQSSGRFHVNVIRGAFNRLTYELIINGVVDGKDYGEYRCQAINDLGITSSYVTLEKSNEPQISVKLGIIIKGSGSQITACISLVFTMFSVVLLHFL